MVTAWGPTAVNSSDPTLNHLTAGASAVTTRAASSNVGTSSATMRRSLVDAEACGARTSVRISGHLQAPDDVGDIVPVVFLKVAHQARADLGRDAGAVDDRRPHRDGSSSGDEELEGILDRGDPTHADHRNAAVACDLPDHPHGDWSDRRTRET